MVKFLLLLIIEKGLSIFQGVAGCGIGGGGESGHAP